MLPSRAIPVSGSILPMAVTLIMDLWLNAPLHFALPFRPILPAAVSLTHRVCAQEARRRRPRLVCAGGSRE